MKARKVSGTASLPPLRFKLVEKYEIGKSTFRIQEAAGYRRCGVHTCSTSFHHVFRVHHQRIDGHQCISQFICEDMETVGGCRTEILRFLSRKKRGAR